MPRTERLDDRTGLGRLLERCRRDLTLRRESDVMGLTVCVVLLAALMVGSDHDPHSRADVLAVVWATTFGIAITHWFALTLSIMLVSDSTFRYRPTELLVSQLGLALIVAVLTSIAVLIAPRDFDRLAARTSAAVCLCVLVGVESRAGGAPLRASIVRAVVALVVATGIAYTKWFVGR